MTGSEKRSRNEDSENLQKEKRQSTGLISRAGLIRRLKRSLEARSRFVDSSLNKSIAFQIRALRDREKWTQGEFAKRLGIKHQNNVSARLENPNYGKHTLTTLKKIAGTCDVGLVVWFIPFRRLVDFETGTPYRDVGLTPAFYEIPAFDKDPGIVAIQAKEAEEDALVRDLGSPQDNDQQKSRLASVPKEENEQQIGVAEKGKRQKGIEDMR